MVVVPRGLSEPFSVAEKLAMFVAGLVVTTGVGVGVGGGVTVAVAVAVAVAVGVGVAIVFATVTVPTIPNNWPCGVQ
jgi:hypothetical protein